MRLHTPRERVALVLLPAFEPPRPPPALVRDTDRQQYKKKLNKMRLVIVANYIHGSILCAGGGGVFLVCHMPWSEHASSNGDVSHTHMY